MRVSILFWLIVLPLSFSLFACEKKAATADRKEKGKRAGKQVPVMTEVAQSIERPRQVSLVTILEGRKQAQVFARVSGKISELGKAEGATVKEGEILFRVDRSEPGDSFLATPVVSPISGWVGRWLVTSIGTQVTMQDPVVTVVDDRALRGRVFLPSDQWQLVTANTLAHVRVGKEERPAKVIGISRAAELQSSRGTVTVEVDNADHFWKAGMVATVRFDLDLRPRIVLPASAVSITDQGNFVFVIKDSRANRVPIVFNVIDNDKVEITEGLRAGAEVIVQGVNQVGDGVAVNVVPRKSGAPE